MKEYKINKYIWEYNEKIEINDIVLRTIESINFIDKKVLDTVRKTNPNAAIIKIKKRWNMYVISLDNYINIFIDFAGMLIGQKVPD